jgi:hypothetical protein
MSTNKNPPAPTSGALPMSEKLELLHSALAYFRPEPGTYTPLAHYNRVLRTILKERGLRCKVSELNDALVYVSPDLQPRISYHEGRSRKYIKGIVFAGHPAANAGG